MLVLLSKDKMPNPYIRAAAQLEGIRVDLVALHAQLYGQYADLPAAPFLRRLLSDMIQVVDVISDGVAVVSGLDDAQQEHAGSSWERERS